MDNHEEMAELLGAYALDAVEGDERDTVEWHLASCPRCRSELEQHREVAALLANTGGAAPVDLWDRIVGSLDDAPPALDLVPARSSARARARRRWLAPVATSVAAAAAVLIAVLGVEVRHQNQRIDQLQAAMVDPLAAAYQQALASPAATVVRLGSGGVQAVLNRDGDAYLDGSRLPRLPAGRTYQLWGQVGGDLVSLGVLGRDPSIVAFHASSVDLLAITDEASGGVVRSARAPLVTGLVA